MRLGVAQAGDFGVQMEKCALLQFTKSRVRTGGHFMQDVCAGELKRLNFLFEGA